MSNQCAKGARQFCRWLRAAFMLGRYETFPQLSSFVLLKKQRKVFRIESLRLHFSEIDMRKCHNVIKVCKLSAEIRIFLSLPKLKSSWLVKSREQMILEANEIDMPSSAPPSHTVISHLQPSAFTPHPSQTPLATISLHRSQLVLPILVAISSSPPLVIGIISHFKSLEPLPILTTIATINSHFCLSLQALHVPFTVFTSSA